MSDFRQSWGIPPKPVKLCPTCQTEHKGKCHFMRSKRHRPATVEESLRYLETKKQRIKMAKVHRLIRELCDAVETGRRAARPTSWLGRKPSAKSGLAVAKDKRASKRNTIARNRTSED